MLQVKNLWVIYMKNSKKVMGANNGQKIEKIEKIKTFMKLVKYYLYKGFERCIMKGNSVDSIISSRSGLKGYQTSSIIRPVVSPDQ